MFYFYILRSNKNNSYYLGSTSDIFPRIKAHNKGRVKSTKTGLPWKLIHKEKYKSFKQANKREYQVKKWKSRKAIERLINNKNKKRR